MTNTIEFWDELYLQNEHTIHSPYTTEQHRMIQRIIPEDVATILDAGCGGGTLMTLLARTGDYEIEGVDQSSEGVRHITENLGMKARVGDITDLHQVPDNSYDLVICSEVLEHLPIPTCRAAVNEMARVAARYLLITNPFKERLTYYQITCSHCESRYHPAGHINSVDEGFMLDLVGPVADSTVFHYSGSREYTSSLYAKILRALGYRLFSDHTVCPLCQSDVPYKPWNGAVRVSGWVYRMLQVVLGATVGRRPAKVITLVHLK